MLPVQKVYAIFMFYQGASKAGEAKNKNHIKIEGGIKLGKNSERARAAWDDWKVFESKLSYFIVKETYGRKNIDWKIERKSWSSCAVKEKLIDIDPPGRACFTAHYVPQAVSGAE